jgi:alpha-tubulin suppressor-like RCC1 family protein
MLVGVQLRAVVGRSAQRRASLLSAAIIATVLAVLGAGPSIAAAEGGSMVAWGENGFLELGAGFKSSMEERPIASLPGVNNVVSVDAGQSGNLAVLGGETAVSWGGNIYGQLGDNSKENIWDKQVDARNPVAPTALSHVQVVTEKETTEEEKTAEEKAKKEAEEKKEEFKPDVDSAEETPPLEHVKAMSTSRSHALAMVEIGKENNTVYAWGNDEYGQDGKGKLNPRERENSKKEKEKTMAGTSPDTPEVVEWEDPTTKEKRKLEHVVAIGIGPESDSDYAVVKDPATKVTSLWAWGKNDKGELGLGGEEGGPQTCKAAEFGEVNCSTYPREVAMPAGVKEGKQHILAVGAGAGYAVALLDNVTVLAWGSNSAGQLGTEEVPYTGSKNRRNTPKEVEGLSEITAIATGEASTLALKKSGVVYGWGSNRWGQLGEESGQLGEEGTEECGGTVCRKFPSKITWKDSEGTHELTGVQAVSEGSSFSVTLHEHKVSTFGNNTDGELGLGTGGNLEPCHEKLEIKEKSGKLVNRFENSAHCTAGPEECVNIRETGIHWRKEWAEKAEYKYGDGVEEGGKKYVAIKEGNNLKRKPNENLKTWWEEISELTGDKIIEVLGVPCGRHPTPVEGIGSVASISAGAFHVVAVLEGAVAQPTPVLTLTPELESLKVKWRVPSKKEVEYQIREGRLILEKTAPEWAPFTIFNLKPGEEELEEHLTFEKFKEKPLPSEPFEVQVRACYPECKAGVNLEKQRYIIGTPLPPAPSVTSISPASGPVAGGTNVTIHGKHLAEASEVKFGSSPASKFKVVSSEEVTAEAPKAGATGTVNVRVTTRGGTSATGAGDEYTYF